MVILISVKCSEPDCETESVIPIRRPGLSDSLATHYDAEHGEGGTLDPWPSLGGVLVHFHRQGWRVGAAGAVCPRCVKLQAAERFKETT